MHQRNGQLSRRAIMPTCAVGAKRLSLRPRRPLAGAVLCNLIHRTNKW